MTNEQIYIYRATIEHLLRNTWRNPRAEVSYFNYPIRLSEEDIFDPAVTEQNIKKIAKRLVLFEELDYDQ